MNFKWWFALQQLRDYRKEFAFRRNPQESDALYVTWWACPHQITGLGEEQNCRLLHLQDFTKEKKSRDSNKALNEEPSLRTAVVVSGYSRT